MDWLNHFRAFIEQPDSSYKLSGVGVFEMFDGRAFYKVPLDPELEMHRPNAKRPSRMIRLSCCCLLSKRSNFCGIRRKFRHSFLIHVCCWDWIKDRFIGPRALQDVDILVSAMRRVWKEHFPLPPYELQEHIDTDGLFGYEWVGDMRAGRPIFGQIEHLNIGPAFTALERSTMHTKP
ncbi:predicted protein [Uncinocarpus reesii 1704]|uniref:Uncharacterized protein n=1 Tax=Uncinocarpus reesii (strain UAMH 1704) TaxID=336963 RepID=C4JWK7_UNCRE|nr:uncharacterized protein UREG_06949 [Uncinocarpus reesii 1704]EEP82084.1 predicted protein [Uncinocarpus reesii 1704]